jgi:hypothetical protein
MTEQPGPNAGADGPTAPPCDPLLARVAFASAESAQVMAALDAQADNLRNLLYRLAQANLTLSEAVAELVGRAAAAKDSRP